MSLHCPAFVRYKKNCDRKTHDVINGFLCIPKEYRYPLWQDFMNIFMSFDIKLPADVRPHNGRLYYDVDILGYGKTIAWDVGYPAECVTVEAEYTTWKLLELARSEERRLKELVHNYLAKIPEDLHSEWKEVIFKRWKKAVTPDWESILEEEAVQYLMHASNFAIETEAEAKLMLGAYHYAFPEARQLKRHFVFLLGPTNSGKTHTAIEDLKNAYSGVYLSPLRLLALENYERMNEAGVPTNLRTGDERIHVPTARHISSTIQMFNPNEEYEVAVIDEIQMLNDKNNGWAWTNAVLGVRAKTVYVAGAPECVPLLKQMLALTGDTFEVREFERKVPMKWMKKPLFDWTGLKKGDAIVAFSRREVLMLREMLKNDHKVAVLYGNLTAEVRREESRRYREGEADILIATDVIGMGLNLPIPRVLFHSAKKFDGEKSRMLYSTEIKQIAGRTGRYGMYDVGYVGGTPSLSKTELSILQDRYYEPPFQGRTKALIAPDWGHIETLSRLMNTGSLVDIYNFFVYRLCQNSKDFEPAKLEDNITLAEFVPHDMPLEKAFYYTQTPLNIENEQMVAVWVSWMEQDLKDGKVIWKDPPKPAAKLEYYEMMGRLATAYRWLAYKFPDIYTDMDGANEAHERANHWICRWLTR